MSERSVEVGVGYPRLCEGVDRQLLLSWAQRAEDAGFDCLSSGERLSGPTTDLMTTMAMVGAVTSRIRLMATVAQLPLHSTGYITKQAATLDVLTEGRFTLGVGVGHRPDDYAAAEVDKPGRLVRFEQQLASMRRQWRGQPLDGDPPIGPPPHTPGGPRVLIGPIKAIAARRAPLADGIVSFGTDPAQHLRLYRAAADAWAQAGRDGRPYFAAGTYFALGPGAEAKAREHLAWHHGGDMVPGEVYFVPVIAELDHVDRLAALR